MVNIFKGYFFWVLINRNIIFDLFCFSLKYNVFGIFWIEFFNFLYFYCGWRKFFCLGCFWRFVKKLVILFYVDFIFIFFVLFGLSYIFWMFEILCVVFGVFLLLLYVCLLRGLLNVFYCFCYGYWCIWNI